MYAEFSLPPEWRRCEEEHGADCKYSRPDPMTGSSRLPSSTAAVFTQIAEIAEIGEREANAQESAHIHLEMLRKVDVAGPCFARDDSA